MDENNNKLSDHRSTRGSRTPSPAQTVDSRSANTRTRKRRGRTTFSERVRSVLDASFMSDPYPDIVTRETLASDTGVDEARIQTWFQNKRSRSKRYIDSYFVRRHSSTPAAFQTNQNTPISLTTPLSLSIPPHQPIPIATSTPIRPLLIRTCLQPPFPITPYMSYPQTPPPFIPPSPVAPSSIWLQTLNAYMYYTMTQRRAALLEQQTTPFRPSYDLNNDEPQDLSTKRKVVVLVEGNNTSNRTTEESPDSSGYTSRESISPLNVIN